MNKDYCHLCGKEIEYNGIEPSPITCSIGNGIINYCGEHSEIGREIFDKFLSEKNKLNRVEGYCNEEKLLNKIESQYKNNLGDWNIQFSNLHHSGQELLNTPILKDGKPIGFITNVNRDYITGRIWSRYIPIVEEIAVEDHHAMSFKLVC